MLNVGIMEITSTMMCSTNRALPSISRRLMMRRQIHKVRVGLSTDPANMWITTPEQNLISVLATNMNSGCQFNIGHCIIQTTLFNVQTKSQTRSSICFFCTGCLHPSLPHTLERLLTFRMIIALLPNLITNESLQPIKYYTTGTWA